MVFKSIICIFAILIAIKSVRPNDMVAQNEIHESNYNGDQLNYEKRNEIDDNRPIDTMYGQPQTLPSVGPTWLDSARNALSGPTGQIVVHMAKEMISRSTGNSQILSLNLTNLLILVLLKALIFAAGLIGAGNWGNYARARNFDSSLIETDEAPLFIGYLALEGSGQDGCLNQAACQSPDTAEQYLKAAMAVIKGTEMFDKNYFSNTTTNYSYTLNQLEHAIKRGMEGAPCDVVYHCHV